MKRTAAILLSVLLFSCATFGQKEELVLAHDKAVAFLLSQQLENGSFADSTNPLFNVWETILVCDALGAIETPSAKQARSKALDFLQASENEKDLMCHNSRCQEATCVETSSYYFSLICQDSERASDIPLTMLGSMQAESGYWDVLNPSVREAPQYASVTAFVVNLFTHCGYSDYNKAAALNYIANQQLADGSWGQYWEYYNCPGYALWQCMRALKGEAEYADNYRKGLDFILETQREDGSWHYKDSIIENVTSPELQSALMVQSLLGETDSRAQAAVDRALAFLLRSQNENGSFHGGYFPIQNARYKKAEYILATSLTIRAFQQRISSLKE